MRLTTRIDHARSLAELSDRIPQEKKPYKKDTMKYVMMPGMAKKRHIFVDQRTNKLKEYAEDFASGLNTVEYNNKKLGIITSGISYQYTKEVFPDASILKIGMVHPLPDKLIREFAQNVEELLIIENHVLQMGIKAEGKKYFTNQGELNTTIIRQAYKGEKLESAIAAEAVEAPARPPVLCPGCPHRGVFYVLSGMKVRVSGDIGCYTLGAMKPYEAVDTCVCMGASVSMAHGMDKADAQFGEKIPTVAVIGDSTFMHSGITGLIDIVYNKGTSTVIILDNSITGMTGHQDNPTTGYTIRKEPTTQTNLIALCKAIGVKNVVEVNAFDTAELERIIKEETARDDVSVIITKSPCVLLKGNVFPDVCVPDSDKCKKCGRY